LVLSPQVAHAIDPLIFDFDWTGVLSEDPTIQRVQFETMRAAGTITINVDNLPANGSFGKGRVTDASIVLSNVGNSASFTFSKSLLDTISGIISPDQTSIAFSDFLFTNFSSRTFGCNGTRCGNGSIVGIVGGTAVGRTVVNYSDPATANALASLKATRQGASVPGPLPVLGAAAAFGYSRKLRKRINSRKQPVASTTD
jgi:hypothetical protein